MHEAIAVLANARDALKADDSVPPTQRSPKAAEIDRAIGLLRLCARYGIQPNAEVVVLPAQGTQTPSSEYRVMEDHETDDRSRWTEVKVRGVPVRAHEGHLLVRVSG
jgi:hypothetical protein